MADAAMIRCSKCREPRDCPGQRYCRACHAAFMRKWRKAHPLVGEARKRQTTRAYARTYIVRGKLTPEPCAVCGEPEVQMHHPDYSQPLLVTWLCRAHHLELHALERNVSREKISQVTERV